nr:hypothetical protein [Edaphobacter aggregans]
MRFVPIKTDDQLDLQAIHRVQGRLISRRTAVINQLRAFLRERGIVFAQKPAKLKAAMADILDRGLDAERFERQPIAQAPRGIYQCSSSGPNALHQGALPLAPVPIRIDLLSSTFGR